MAFVGIFWLLIWIVHLHLASSRDSHEAPGLELHVLAYRRPHCLERLLNSLQSAHYPSEHRVSLTVHIDVAGNDDALVQETIQVSQEFMWSYGPYEVSLAETHQGVFASWLSAVSPDPTRWPLILEDDLTVSPFFYQFLWATWTQNKDRASLAGISLGQHWGDDASPASTVDPKLLRPYLSQVPGPWGFSPSPHVWQAFIDFCKAHPRIDEELPGVKLSAWYRTALREGRSDGIWTFHFASFLSKYNYKILYAPVFQGPKGERQGLVANHRERGEHFDGSAGPDVRIYMGHNWETVRQLSSAVGKVPWHVERRALYEGGRVLQAYGSSGGDEEETVAVGNSTQASGRVRERFPAKGWPLELSWGQHYYLSFAVMVMLLAAFYFVKSGSSLGFIALVEMCIWVACAAVAEYGLPTEKRLPEGDANMFWAVFMVALVCGFFHPARDKSDSTPVPMSRNMTNEWKGLMQMTFEMYHYTDYWHVYAPVRASVSAYVWLTGWGNTRFFVTKKDHSIKRVLGMLFRLGAFCPLIAMGTDTPWISYYIVALHAAHFLMVFMFSLCGGFRAPFPGAVMLKLAVLVVVIEVLQIDVIADRIQDFMEAIFGSFFASYLRWRMEMDRFSSIPGIVVGYYWDEILKFFQDGTLRHRIFAFMFCSALFAIWIVVALTNKYSSASARADFTEVHPYVSTFWIPLFVLCRNGNAWLRRVSIKPFEVLGKRSLELYLLQFNLFLARQGNHNLVITGYPTVDVFMCWFIIMFGGGRCFYGTKNVWIMYSETIGLALMTGLLFAVIRILDAAIDLSWFSSCLIGVIFSIVYIVFAETALGLSIRSGKVVRSSSHDRPSRQKSPEALSIPIGLPTPAPSESTLAAEATTFTGASSALPTQSKTKSQGGVSLAERLAALSNPHHSYYFNNPSKEDYAESWASSSTGDSKDDSEPDEPPPPPPPMDTGVAGSTVLNIDTMNAPSSMNIATSTPAASMSRLPVGSAKSVVDVQQNLSKPLPTVSVSKQATKKAAPAASKGKARASRLIPGWARTKWLPPLGSFFMFAFLIVVAAVWKMDEGAFVLAETTTTTTTTTTIDWGGWTLAPTPVPTPAPTPVPTPVPTPPTTTTSTSTTTTTTTTMGTTTTSTTTLTRFVPGSFNFSKDSGIVVTSTSDAVAAGAIQIHVADVSDLSVGMTLRIASNQHSETKIINTVSLVRRLSSHDRRMSSLLGSVVIDSPLEHSYEIAAFVMAIPVPPTTTTTTTTSTTTTTTTTTTITTTTTTTCLNYCQITDIEWVFNSATQQAEIQKKSSADCYFKRYTREEAIALLDGRYIMMTGDSTMHYQYIALCMYLHPGLDIKANQNWMLYQLGYPGEGNSQRFFQDWYTNVSLMFDGNEHCDCNRDLSCHPLCDPQTYIQTRHFRFGNDGLVSYVVSGGEILLPQAHNFDFDSWQLNCQKIMCNHPPDWSEPFRCYIDVMQSVVDRYKPDILIQGVDNHIIYPYDWLIDILKFTPDKQGTLCGMNWVDFGAEFTRRIGTTSGGERGKPLVLTRSNSANQTGMFHYYNTFTQPSPTLSDDQVMFDVEYLTLLAASPPLRGYPGNPQDGGRIMSDIVHMSQWMNLEINLWMLHVIASRISCGG